MSMPSIPADISAQLSSCDRIVIGALITNDAGEILFLKRAADEIPADVWEIPSGGTEENETLEETLRREVYEETGLTTDEITAFVSAATYTISGKRCLQLNFRVTWRGEVVLSAEHAEYTWATIDAFYPKLDTFMREILKEV